MQDLEKCKCAAVQQWKRNQIFYLSKGSNTTV